MADLINGHVPPPAKRPIAIIDMNPDGTVTLTPAAGLSPKVLVRMLCQLAAAYAERIQEAQVQVPDPPAILPPTA